MDECSGRAGGVGIDLSLVGTVESEALVKNSSVEANDLTNGGGAARMVATGRINGCASARCPSATGALRCPITLTRNWSCDAGAGSAAIVAIVAPFAPGLAPSASAMPNGGIALNPASSGGVERVEGYVVAEIMLKSEFGLEPSSAELGAFDQLGALAAELGAFDDTVLLSATESKSQLLPASGANAIEESDGAAERLSEKEAKDVATSVTTWGSVSFASS